MSVRLFHKNARIVLVRSKTGSAEQIWWSPHLAPRDWATVLHPALDLLVLAPEEREESTLRFRLGSMHWTNARYWSTITLRFDAGSDRKRELVATALLKAARYRQQQEAPCPPSPIQRR